MFCDLIEGARFGNFGLFGMSENFGVLIEMEAFESGDSLLKDEDFIVEVGNFFISFLNFRLELALKFSHLVDVL